MFVAAAAGEDLVADDECTEVHRELLRGRTGLGIEHGDTVLEPMAAQGFEHVMDEGEAGEGRGHQVDHRHIGEQRRAATEQQQLRPPVFAQALQFGLVGMQHQGVVAEGALVEPAGERDRDQQAGAGNQPQRQRNHERNQEQHAGEDRVPRAPEVGAAPTLLEIGVVGVRDALEHHRQRHRADQHGGGDIDERHDEQGGGDLDQHEHDRRGGLGGGNPAIDPRPAAHHGVEPFGDRRPGVEGHARPDHHGEQPRPQQVPEDVAPHQAAAGAPEGDENVLHCATSLSVACPGSRPASCPSSSASSCSCHPWRTASSPSASARTG